MNLESFVGIRVNIGVNEVVDTNRTRKQKRSNSGFEFEVEAETASGQTVLAISNPILFNSKQNKVLEVINTHDSE